ncbi:molybdopterin molybdotransferase MoeA [Tsuneonella sp. YG55]|uniref:Molybdopterin molybdenumtransferase n=1 Tax=Tsuneonella litorea TaxID=2976475 RepID=A0A9X3AKY5_9SPHN|nr:molybdopterin molybdotransferase MoeA [Tsuneonella litorea]MCT2558964.1 molybdopterin molybdotransferase MoeA [Tsuneonella litorea]
MIGLDEALALIADRVVPLGTETVPLAESAGRTLAEDLCARSDSPRHAVSVMDGYAVIDAATRPGKTFAVVGESRAGSGFDRTLKPGEAVRIFTGARLPAGADRVIVQEHAERDGERVRFVEGYGPATHVRPAASDFRAGDVLLAAGTRLDPRALVTAGAADRAEVRLARRPRVAVIGTGDELAAPGSAHLEPDAVPESVTLGVAAMVEAEGGTIVARDAAADELAALTRHAGRALDQADLVVVTGGASVGERDFAKPMFEAHGLDLVFSKVAIKPGKPVWLGLARGKVVLGLPGNPTSAMVTATLFLKPILARLQGVRADHAWRRLPLAAPLAATGDRETFVRARWAAEGLVPLGNQDSGAQGPLARADWLVRCPPHHGERAAGTEVMALAF